MYIVYDPFAFQKITILNKDLCIQTKVFDNCHPDLVIYCPDNSLVKDALIKRNYNVRSL